MVRRLTVLVMIWVFLGFGRLAADSTEDLFVKNKNDYPVIKFILHTDDPDNTVHRQWTQGQKEALLRAGEFWMERLMGDLDVTINIDVYPSAVTNQAFAGPLLEGTLGNYDEMPLKIIQDSSYSPYYSEHGHINIGVISEPNIELLSNLPNGFAHETVLIHELGHIFGITNINQTAYPLNEQDYGGNQIEIDDKWYFTGEEANSVYHDGQTGFTDLPADNDQNDVDSARAHIGIFGSMMGYGAARNYPMLLEAELAIFKDLNYDIDLRNFFGRSIYTSGTAGNRNTIINNNGFSARNAAGTEYTGEPNNSTYGIGLHVFGEYNDITQNADLLAGGVSSAGIRIDGTENSLKISPGVTVAADGDRGTGLLVAFGSNQKVNHQGTISAAGDSGVGLRFDFGISGAFPGVTSGKQGAFYSEYNSGGSSAEYNYLRAQLSGPLTSAVDITGSITANGSGKSAAVYIGPGAYVPEINIMRAYNGNSPAVSGNIISDYDILRIPWDFNNTTTVINFGLAANSSGSKTAASDASFVLDLDGQILGYEAPWVNNLQNDHYLVYQEGPEDTFLGRGLIDLNFYGGQTSVSNNVWVNKLDIKSGAALIARDSTNFKTKEDKITLDGLLKFENDSNLSFASQLVGGGQLQKSGSGTLYLGYDERATFTGQTAVNSGLLSLTSAGGLGGVQVNSGGAVSGTGTIANLNVDGGKILSGGSNETLTVSQNLTLNGAVIGLDPARNMNTELITVQGNLIFGANPNSVDLLSWGTGLYKLISSVFSPIAVLDGKLETVSLEGTVLDNIYKTGQLSRTNNDKEIWLTVEDLAPDGDLEWTGAVSSNWFGNTWEKVNEAAYFSANKYVIFKSGQSNTDIVLAEEAVTAGMLVSGGTYSFSGSQIKGLYPAASPGNTRTGKLEVTGGQISVQNTLDFVNGLAIGASGKVILLGSGSLASAMAAVNNGILEISRSQDYVFSNTLSGSGALYKTGTGSLTLSGVMSQASGTLFHQIGALTLASSWGGNYNQASGTALTVQNESGIQGNASFSGQVQPLGLLNIGGNAAFSGAVIKTDLTINPLIAAAGTVSFSGTQTIFDLPSFELGGYLLMTGAGFSGTSPGVTLNAASLSGRQSAEFSYPDAQSLLLTLSSINLPMTWNGPGQAWSGSNWVNNSETGIISGDKAIFDGSGPGQVQLSQAFTVSDLEIAAGEYLFTGASLTGSVSGTSLAAPGGKLQVAAPAKASFANALNFQSLENSGTVILLDSGSFNNSMPIQNDAGAVLEISRSQPYNFGGTLSGAGNLKNSEAGHLTLSGNLEAAAGNLLHEAGTITLAADYGGDYIQSPLTVFHYSDGASIAGTAQFSGEVHVEGILNLGQAVFDGAEIKYGLDASSKINVSGSVVSSGTNNIDLSAFSKDTYYLMTADSLTGDLPSVTLNGQALAARQTANVTNQAGSLVLELDYDNLALTWSGTGNSFEGPNWNSGTESFITGDGAKFDGSGPAAVQVDQPAKLAYLDIDDGAYTFSGASLSGTITDTSLAGATGNLTVAAGASASFANVLDFSFLNNSGTVKLLNSGSFDPDMTVSNSGTLEFAQSESCQWQSPLTGSGEAVKTGSGLLTVNSGTMDAFSGTFRHEAGQVNLNG
ncbi:MAG: hypothetical protein LBK52_05980, partial [Deltaproteobacteria bacterium]|nr:hypothetical protein [Deltaproteobacteria bacterium]